MKQEDAHLFYALPQDELMGLCIEREAGGEILEGKIGVGTVILDRVEKHDWEGKTIQEVILHPWQFSWTMPQAGEAYYDATVKMLSEWEKTKASDHMVAFCIDLAKKLISGEQARDAVLHEHKCCQYLNPETAAPTKEKWLAAGMKVIKEIGKHEFFSWKGESICTRE